MSTKVTHHMSGGAETHFAKKLASNEKTVRDKAVKKLRLWLSSSRFVSSGLSETDLLKLWKGLFYCMWMSDKPRIQEELAETIAQLLNNFSCTNSAFQFLAGFFKTMHREWHGIDRLRLDKFYLLIRKFIYQSILFLKRHNWNKETISQLNVVLTNGPLNSNSDSVEFANGVQVHVIQVYLDELFKIGLSEVDNSIFLKLLEPFSKLLATSKSHVVTRSISKNVFNVLLDMKDNNIDNCSKLDFSDLAEQFFTLASRKDIQGRNRNALYNYINKFKKAKLDQEANGTDEGQMRTLLNCIHSPSISTNEMEHVLKEVNTHDDSSTDGLVDILSNVPMQKNSIKKNRKRKNDNSESQPIVESQPVDIQFRSTIIEDDLQSDASGKTKQRKLRKIEKSEELENDLPAEKSSTKNKRKNERKSETSNNSSINAKKEDNPIEEMEDELEDVNLDGSYLSTIPIMQQKVHDGDGKHTELETQHNGNTTECLSPLNISSTFVETMLCSNKPTADARSKTARYNQPNKNQQLKNVNAESPPFASFLRHSIKKANTEPRKKKEKICSINEQCNSARSNRRKQVRIELSKNTSHTTRDYRQTLKSSPIVPFDANKKPVQSSLKAAPEPATTLNKSKGDPKSKKRPTAVDFF